MARYKSDFTSQNNFFHVIVSLIPYLFYNKGVGEKGHTFFIRCVIIINTIIIN